MDEEGFKRFYEAYPKKRSRGDAFKAWQQTATKRPATEQILKALAVLKASQDWRRDGGQYIPYPASWLRAWGWDDVPEVDLGDVRRDGKMWWESVSGIQEKASSLGMEIHDGETFQAFTKRVRSADHSARVVPMMRSA